MIIFTHDKKAHVDELIACALIATKHLEQYEVLQVVRMSPNDDIPELKNKYYAVDIGGIYDGKKRFDHHQKEESVKDECAATLVAKTFFPEYLQTKNFCRFLQRINIQDNHGMGRVREHYDLDYTNPFLFLEHFLLKQFEKHPSTTTQDLARYFKDEITFFENVKIAYDWTKDHTSIEENEGLKGLHELFQPPEHIDFQALKKAEGHLIKEHNLDYVLGFDNTNSTIPTSIATKVLFRTYNAKDKFDLSKVEVKDCIFQHKNGFLLKYEQPYVLVRMDTLRNILKQAKI